MHNNDDANARIDDRSLLYIFAPLTFISDRLHRETLKTLRAIDEQKRRSFAVFVIYIYLIR